MSEIPMPEPDGYAPVTPEKKKGCCGRFVMCIVVIAVVVVGIIAITALLGGPGSEYGERVVASYSNENPEIYPTYYRSEFSVSSSETQTSTVPDLLFDISLDTGSDSVTTHIAVYEIDQDTFDSIDTWSGLSNYLIAEDDISGDVFHYINLNNYADTYTWVIWFDASGKADTWSIDITLTLRYNY